MSEKVNILGVNVNSLTMDSAVKKAEGLIQEGGFHCVFTPNPEIIWNARKDPELKEILNNADLLLPDGIGVVMASKIKKQPMPERVSGYDFTRRLLDLQGHSFFLFGAKPGVAESAAEKLRKENPQIQIAGTRNGYFDDEKDTDDIINQINQSGADVLIVCLGVPKQERWIYRNRKKLKPALCIGVGGTLDVIAGVAKRAPDIFIKLNLEWLYRTVKQPSRLKRNWVLPVFMLNVLFCDRKSNERN